MWHSHTIHSTNFSHTNCVTHTTHTGRWFYRCWWWKQIKGKLTFEVHLWVFCFSRIATRTRDEVFTPRGGIAKDFIPRGGQPAPAAPIWKCAFCKCNAEQLFHGVEIAFLAALADTKNTKKINIEGWRRPLGNSEHSHKTQSQLGCNHFRLFGKTIDSVSIRSFHLFIFI